MSGTPQDEDQIVKLRVLRTSPEGDTPRWVEYVTKATAYDRVLDLLIRVKGSLDGSLTFRRSCGHGVCGSCAMRINGSNRLACQTLVKSLGDVVTVQPLPGLPVMRDLVVDMLPVFAAYQQVRPFMRQPKHMPLCERIQTPDEHRKYEETTRCIMCAACTTACPVYQAETGDLGPAALVQAHRFVFDSRDIDREARLIAINARRGVWRCRTAYGCTAACPQGIGVTKVIGELKQELFKGLRRTSKPTSHSGR